MKQLVILRGPPGSGKSFVTELYREEYDARTCSADSFFLVDGEYKFDPRKLGEAHASCLRDFLYHIDAEAPFIVVDNTNSCRWEYANYEAIGLLHGYEVRIENMAVNTREEFQRCLKRTSHGVPFEVAAAMWCRWEKDTRAKEIPLRF